MIPFLLQSGAISTPSSIPHYSWLILLYIRTYSKEYWRVMALQTIQSILIPTQETNDSVSCNEL